MRPIFWLEPCYFPGSKLFISLYKIGPLFSRNSIKKCISFWWLFLILEYIFLNYFYFNNLYHHNNYNRGKKTYQSQFLIFPQFSNTIPNRIVSVKRNAILYRISYEHKVSFDLLFSFELYLFSLNSFVSYQYFARKIYYPVFAEISPPQQNVSISTHLSISFRERASTAFRLRVRGEKYRTKIKSRVLRNQQIAKIANRIDHVSGFEFSSSTRYVHLQLRDAILRRIREIDELFQFATIHQEVGAMKLFRFFLFSFFSTTVCFFFLFFFCVTISTPEVTK